MGFACVHHHLAQNSFFTALNVLGSTYLSLPLPPKALTNIYLFTVSFTAPFPELHRAGIIQLLLLRCSVLSDILQPQELQHARVPCPSPSPEVCSNSYPLSQWCHSTISPVTSFSSCPQSFPASGSFPMGQFFASGGQSIGASASASVPPMNIQDWFPLGLADLISLHPQGLSRVFSNITVQKHQFFGAQLSL